MNQHVEVANIIASQMGGTGKLGAIIGAKYFSAINEECGALGFQHMKGQDKSGKPVNYCKITLDGSDTYTMTFGWIRGTNYTVRATVEGVYCDQLLDIFEANTGLFLTLRPRR